MHCPIRSHISTLALCTSFIESASLFVLSVSAGFPSPAEDYEEGPLDLNTHLIAHPAATFFVRVSGDSMKEAGIFSGDLLIVDRSLTPVSGKVIIAVLDGALTVKRLYQRGNTILLVPENSEYAAIPVKEEQQFEVWGVVTHVIHAV